MKSCQTQNYSLKRNLWVHFQNSFPWWTLCYRLPSTCTQLNHSTPPLSIFSLPEVSCFKDRTTDRLFTTCQFPWNLTSPQVLKCQTRLPRFRKCWPYRHHSFALYSLLFSFIFLVDRNGASSRRKGRQHPFFCSEVRKNNSVHLGFSTLVKFQMAQ